MHIHRLSFNRNDFPVNKCYRLCNISLLARWRSMYEMQDMGSPALLKSHPFCPLPPQGVLALYI